MATIDDSGPKTKTAWMYAYSISPYCIGFPGIQADLFFSSPTTFAALWGRPLGQREWLLEVQVPENFTDWDYVPNDY